MPRNDALMGGIYARAQAKLAQLRQHAEDMVQSVLSNPKISEQALRDLAEHERRAPLSCLCLASRGG